MVKLVRCHRNSEPRALTPSFRLFWSMSLWLSASISALLICTIPTWGAAAVSNEIRRTTYDGLPLDEPITFRLRDVLLRIPAGYIAPWPRLEFRNRVIEAKQIRFNFWMPDRRYVEIDDLSIASPRPQERGRPLPPADAYVVKMAFQLLGPNEPAYVPPEKKFENATRNPGLSSYSFEERFGLLRFWRHDWPHPRPEPFTRYRHMDGSDPQVLLSCVPENVQLPNPGCTGDIYFEAERLALFLHIPRDQLPHWREIVSAARDLFNSWKATQ